MEEVNGIFAINNNHAATYTKRSVIRVYPHTFRSLCDGSIFIVALDHFSFDAGQLREQKIDRLPEEQQVSLFLHVYFVAIVASVVALNMDIFHNDHKPQNILARVLDTISIEKAKTDKNINWYQYLQICVADYGLISEAKEGNCSAQGTPIFTEDGKNECSNTFNAYQIMASFVWSILIYDKDDEDWNRELALEMITKQLNDLDQSESHKMKALKSKIMEMRDSDVLDALVKDIIINTLNSNSNSRLGLIELLKHKVFYYPAGSSVADNFIKEFGCANASKSVNESNPANCSDTVFELISAYCK